MGEPKNRGRAGMGRPKGSPNKTTALLKDQILGALDRVGGIDYLARQAEENPSAFMTLIGKVLPTQVVGQDDGKGGYDEIRHVIVRPGHSNP